MVHVGLRKHKQSNPDTRKTEKLEATPKVWMPCRLEFANFEVFWNVGDTEESKMPNQSVEKIWRPKKQNPTNAQLES